LAFFAQTTARFCKNMIITLVFEKNAKSFAENWQKSQKIVIIASTIRMYLISRQGYVQQHIAATVVHSEAWLPDFS
jgi:hypothetical protein